MKNSHDYYPLEPIGLSSGLGESLTGFLCRFAIAHEVSTNKLLEHLDEIAHTRISPSYTLLDSRAFNSCGDTSKRIRAAMHRALPTTDLTHAALTHIGRSFCPTGRGLLSWNRHWCPECFIEQRENGEVVYDRLCWQIANTKLCSVHLCELHSACPHCGEIQHRMPPTGHIDICSKTSCAGWLADTPTKKTTLLNSDLAYYQWVAHEIPKLLSAQAERGQLLTGTEVSATLHSICQRHDFSPKIIGEKLNKQPGDVRAYMNGRKKPVLCNWLRHCATLNLSPVDTLFLPLQSGTQLDLDYPLPELPKLKPRKPKRHYSGQAIRDEIERQLELPMPTVNSIKDLARQMDVSESSIDYHCNSGSRRLAKKTQDIRKQQSRDFHRHLKRVGVKLIVARHMDGLSTNRLEFAETLRDKEACSLHKAKDIFSLCAPRAIRIITRISP